jgi:poly(beta-D-mannuronate) lyase
MLALFDEVGRMKRFGSIACLAVVAIAGCSHDPMAPPPGPAMAPVTLLHSPWDTNPVTLTDQPYTCSALPEISPDILVTNGVGAQKKVSEAVKQAVYAESDEALHDLTSRSVSAADYFQHTGSRSAAHCVIALLATAANDHSMAGYMADGDAFKEQNQALRATAVAYLKVRNSGMATEEEQGLIAAWMIDIASSERHRAETGVCGKRYCDLYGHIGLSVAMAASAVGVATNNLDLFRWSVAQFRLAVRNVDGAGMLHYDTHGAYALKFNLVSAASLVQIAEFGELNGVPLYAYDDGRIHLLIHTVSRGLVDPGPYSNAARAEQKVSKSIEPWQVSWATIYNRRFPDPVLTGLLEQVGTKGADMWGGEPWGS